MKFKKERVLFIIFVLILPIFLVFQTKKLIITNPQKENSKIISQISSKESEVQTFSPFSGMPCINFSKRPFAIVISQELQSFPIFGISEADLVIEMPYANPKGVTRLLVFFQCKEPQRIEPIRSLRPYMVDLAKGFDAILVSWGACEEAYKRALSLKVDWLSPVLYVKGSEAFFRDPNRQAPHNSYTSISSLKNVVRKLKIREENKFEGYLFKKALEKNEMPYVSQVDVDAYFYKVSWRFDPEKKVYFRYFNEKEVIDALNNNQIFARNLILMKTQIGTLVPGVANIKVIGEGEARIYIDGQMIEGKWKKEAQDKKLTFLDKEGKEISFLPGPIWIEIVDSF
jgi:hypothetical protein